jgi:hypothetical protein
MTKSNTNRFVGAAWSLLAFQFIASAGAVAVSAWAVLEVQPRLAELQAMEQNEPVAPEEATPAPATPQPETLPPPPPPPVAPTPTDLLPPLFGSVDLRAGEERSVDVRAGGAFDGSRIGATCSVGLITEQPSLVLRYAAGGLPLNISVGSQADTTLIVRAPDGSWHCNDDAEGYNPRVSWESPASGTYLIWVGRLGAPGQFDTGLLSMSHHRPGVIQ